MHRADTDQNAGSKQQSTPALHFCGQVHNAIRTYALDIKQAITHTGGTLTSGYCYSGSNCFLFTYTQNNEKVPGEKAHKCDVCQKCNAYVC